MIRIRKQCLFIFFILYSSLGNATPGAVLNQLHALQKALHGMHHQNTVLLHEVSALKKILIHKHAAGLARQTLSKAFFSWINPEDQTHLGGMRLPQSNNEIKALEALNTGVVVTLTEEKVLPPELFKNTNVKNIRIPIKDFHIPTLDQVKTFVQVVDQTHDHGKNVVVHCWGGKGRTGTMLACWLVHKKAMHPAQAIAHVRKLRPHSIETPAQEELIHDFFYNQKFFDVIEEDQAPNTPEPLLPETPPLPDKTPTPQKKGIFSGVKSFFSTIWKR